jgi:DNA-binding transcriptional MerR regulator
METKLIDINVVCNMLGCTSRTLRFYEQKGIIQSTTSPFSNRRQYSEEQIQRIKQVLVLRSLGLPVAKIQEWQRSDKSLSEMIAQHQAELVASMVATGKQYQLLCEAASTLESGGDIFSERQRPICNIQNHWLTIVEQFTDDFVNCRYDECFEHFSDMLKEYLPLTTFKRVIADTLQPLGTFARKEKVEKDENANNAYYSYLQYEKLGLYIKIVFAKDKIHGIWLNYYHCDKENVEE